MSKQQLKKLLNSMDKADIMSLILEMYDAKKEIQNYLDFYINPNEKEQFLKYKAIIEKEYSLTVAEPKCRLVIAKKAVSDFATLKPSVLLQAELMMFLVECGCQLTRKYGDMWEGFYDGMYNNFVRALKFMKKHGLLMEFRINAEKCVRLASPCGYGFADDMANAFHDFYE